MKIAVWRALAACLLGVAAAASAQVGTAAAPAPSELAPDVVTESLRAAGLQADPRFARPRWLGQQVPELGVLPVQSQRFGWSPAFMALLGAGLDQALARRGWPANPQTELFDFDGPWARRFDDAALAPLSAAWPGVPLLALHAGHDGAGQMVLTLSLRRGDGAWQRVTRQVPLGPDPAAALDSARAQMPLLLDALGLRARAQDGPPAPASGCRPEDWQADPTAPGLPTSARACRALVQGLLHPTFEWSQARLAMPPLASRARQAWLAQAWVEADALAPDPARAVRAVSWAALGLSLASQDRQALAPLRQGTDPVAHALVRWMSALRQPPAAQESREDWRNRRLALAQEALRGAPRFAQVLMQAAWVNQGEGLEPIRLCEVDDAPTPIGTQVCPASGAAWAAPPAHAGQRAALAEWRQVQVLQALDLQGHLRRDATARERLLQAMPSALTEHPWARRLRFQLGVPDQPRGDAAAVRLAVVDLASGLAQAAADLPFYDEVGAWRPPEDPQAWIGNPRWLADPAIALARQRVAALDPAVHDGYQHVGEAPSAPDEWRRRLAAGDWRVLPPAASATTAAPPARPTEEPTRGPVIEPAFPTSDRALAFLPARIQARPEAMDLRVRLALAEMKRGQAPDQALRHVDAYPITRVQQGPLAYANTWIQPALSLFFVGEFEAARRYLVPVARSGTGGDSEMIAAGRLALLDQDWSRALEQAQRRVDRYGGDSARRDLAGLSFLRGDPATAWTVLRPRLIHTDKPALVDALLTGWRLDRVGAAEALDQIRREGWGGGAHDGLPMDQLMLARHLTEDRLPSEADLSLLPQEPGRPDTLLQVHATLQRLALGPPGDAARMEALRTIIRSMPAAAPTGQLRGLYVLAAWRTGQRDDPTLQGLVPGNLDADVDSLLGTAALLWLRGAQDEALTFVRAAILELGAQPEPDYRQGLRAPGHEVAMVLYGLWRLDPDPRLAAQVLRVARMHQRILPYRAWPWALEAALPGEAAARQSAACQARALDPASWWLGQSGFTAPCAPRSAAHGGTGVR